MYKLILALYLTTTLAFSFDALTSFEDKTIQGCFKQTITDSKKHTILVVRNSKGVVTLIDSLKRSGFEQYHTSLLKSERTDYDLDYFFTAESDDKSIFLWTNSSNEFYALYLKSNSEISLKCSTNKKEIGSIYLDLIL